MAEELVVSSARRGLSLRHNACSRGSVASLRRRAAALVLALRQEAPVRGQMQNAWGVDFPVELPWRERQ